MKGIKREFLLLLLTFLSITSFAGSFDWAKMLTHGARGDYPESIKIDKFDNIIIGGTATGCSACTEGYIAKYDSLGNVIFKYGLSSGGSGSSIKSVGVDSIGNIYFIANPLDYNFTIGPNNFNYPDFNNYTTIVKFNPSGNLLWYMPWGMYNNLNLTVDLSGNVFVTNGDTLKRYNSNGVLVWTSSIIGRIVDVEGSTLLVASSSQIKLVSTSTGGVSNSVAVVGCSDAAVNSNGDIYFTGANGTTKLVNLITAWNMPTLIGSKIDVKSTSIWIGKIMPDPINSIDSSEIININASGTVVLRDTIFNSSLISLSIGLNNKPFVIAYWGKLAGGSGNSLPALFKPFFIFDDYNLAYGGGGFIIGRYNSASNIKLGFNIPFWDVNNYYQGNWSVNSKKCAGGSTFLLSYKLYDGVFLVGNIIFAELSDANGAFGSPLTIGALSSTGTTGNISCQLPVNLVNSANYVIRLKSTFPSLFTSQNSCSLDISAPLSTISLSSANNTFCSKSETLSVVTLGNYYQWQKNTVNIAGSGAPTYLPSSTGTYRCMVSDDNGCSRASTNQLVLTVLPLPAASISPVTAQEVCIGDSVVVTVPANVNNTYQWFSYTTLLPSQIANSYIAKSNGNYKAIVTGANGCSKTSAGFKLSIYKPTVTAFGPTTFCAGGNVVLGASNGSSSSWLWKRNNVNIAGANGQYYTATQAGNYRVYTTNINGCSSLSAAKSVNINCRVEDEEGLESIKENVVLQFYPNPANDRVFVNGLKFDESGYLIIQDLLGRTVNVNTISQTENLIQLDCSHLTSGIYLVSFISDERSIVSGRFVKGD